MMLVILAEFDRRQRADLGKNKCKYFFAIEGAGTEPRPFRKGKAKMTRQRLRRNADRNENSVKCRMYIDTESRVFLQNRHRRHMHEINPICMPGDERQKLYSRHVFLIGLTGFFPPIDCRTTENATESLAADGNRSKPLR